MKTFVRSGIIVAKKIFIKALIELAKPLVKFFSGTKLGRLIYFSSLPSDQLVIANCRGGEKIIVNSSDLSIGRDTYFSALPYDQEKVDYAFKILLDNNRITDTVIDVGANIGTISISAVLKKYCKRAIAFEPEPFNYYLLNLNIWINGLADIVEVHNLALSDGSNEYLNFELDSKNFGDHRVRVSEANGNCGEPDRQVISVKAGKLDDYVNEDILGSKNCLLWMDTQGFEGFILKGASSIFSTRTPIVTEFWPYGLNRSGSFDLMISALTSGSYSYIYILDKSERRVNCTREELLNIADELGWNGNFTDLLLM
jgi:FkbM family methyltransferase